MAEVLMKDVRKSFGKVEVVHGVDCNMEDGEFIVIVGPSGCGKSTVLRMIAGLERITAGEISIGGRVVNNLEPAERDIAMVFQNYALYPHMSVYKNMAYGLKIRRMPKSEIEERVQKAAKILELSEFLNRKPRQLSGGQRQRVAMGRAIVREPKVFLFDEPLSNLDAKLRDGMREEIKRLHKQLGKTFIYVTHDQIEAMTLAERIVLLKDGVIEQAGAPLDLFERPANIYVAGFLGSPPMNFIDVELSDGALVLPDGQKLAAGDLLAANPGLSDGKYRWGVRPEHFTMQERVGSPIRAKLDVIQPTGSRSYGTFYIGGAHMVAELEAHVGERDTREIDLHVSLERTVLFDPETGAAVR